MKRKLMKYTVLMCVAMMAASSLAACSSNNEKEPEAVVAEADLSENAEEAIVEEAEEEANEMLQDFIGEMDLAGSWEDEISQRAGMDIVRNDDGSYDIRVHWGGSATETAIWEIHGTYDEKSGMLSYDDGKYSIHTWDENDNETISDEEKTSGSFMKEGDKLRWKDSKNTDDGLFVKVQ